MTPLHYACAIFFILAFSTTFLFIVDIVKMAITKSEQRVVPIIIQAIFWAAFIISTLLILKQ